jgi:hypothetical protein
MTDWKQYEQAVADYERAEARVIFCQKKAQKMLNNGVFTMVEYYAREAKKAENEKIEALARNAEILSTAVNELTHQ